MSESQNIEWKESWQDKYLQWICAFANSEGGVLYIGKDDNGSVIHLEKFQSLLEDIPSKIKNHLGIICSVALQDEGGLKYLKIEVRAYANPISYKGKFYVRSGSTTHELNGVELSDFLLLKSGKTWDDVIIEDASIEDIDSSAIKKLISDSEGKGRLPDTDKLSDFEMLEKLRLTSGTQLKRAAIVLFGNDPNRFFPNCKVMLGRFGKDSEELKFQEPLEGNLVFLLDEVQNQLNYKFFTKPVDFKGMMRHESDEYPVAAIREMLLNALVHKKYVGSAIQIRVFDDKISIWNEGILPQGLSIDNLKEEHNSKPPNPIVAEVCFKAGYIDTWGRGTLKIYKACAEAGLPEPQIVAKNGGIEVTLFKLSITPEVSEEYGSNSEGIQKEFGKNSERIRKEFGIGVEKTYKIICEYPEYTAKQIADQLEIVPRTVENHQAKLKEGGYIERKGGNLGGYWNIK